MPTSSARALAACLAVGHPTTGDFRPEGDYAYLTRLQNSSVTAGTAVLVGRDLLTEHATATLALSATAATEPAIQPTAAGGLQAAPTHSVAPIGAEPPLGRAPAIGPRRIQL